MSGGPLQYLVPAWVAVSVLRRRGCKLPIEARALARVEREWEAPEVFLFWPMRCTLQALQQGREGRRITRELPSGPTTNAHQRFK